MSTPRQFVFSVSSASDTPPAGYPTVEGTVTQLSTPSLTQNDSNGSWPWQSPWPNDSGTVSDTLDWCSNLSYCPATGRVMAAGGRPFTDPTSQKLIYFDPRTLVWDSVANPFGVGGGHLYQSHCAATSIRRFFYVPQSTTTVRVWNTQSWGVESPLPAMPFGMGDAICLMWMPNLGAQGSLIAAGQPSLTRQACLRFDWASQAWSTVFDIADSNIFAATAGHFAGVYVPAADACIFGNSKPVPSLDLTLYLRPMRVLKSDGSVTVTPVPLGTISAFDGTGILTPHPTQAMAIHFCRWSNRVSTYDFTTNTWADRGAIPSQFDVRYQAGATIPEWGMVVVVSGGDVDAVGTKTYAYKVPTW